MYSGKQVLHTYGYLVLYNDDGQGPRLENHRRIPLRASTISALTTSLSPSFAIFESILRRGRETRRGRRENKKERKEIQPCLAHIFKHLRGLDLLNTEALRDKSTLRMALQQFHRDSVFYIFYSLQLLLRDQSRPAAHNQGLASYSKLGNQGITRYMPHLVASILVTLAVASVAGSD